MATTFFDILKTLLLYCTAMFSSLAVVTVCENAERLPRDCLVIGEILDCAFSIPGWIPPSTTRLYIRGYNQTAPLPFKNDSSLWENITELDVTIDQELIDYNILNDPFRGFKSLKFLGLHGRNMNRIGQTPFVGLTSLEKLDLSGCMLLTLHGDILPALATASLPNLASLNIAGVETAGSRFMTLSYEAINVINHYPLNNVNVSGTNIVFEKTYSGRSVIVEYLDVSNVTLAGSRKIKLNAPILKSVNFSNNERFVSITSLINIKTEKCLLSGLRGVPLQYIYANRISDGPLIYRNSSMDCFEYSQSIFDHLQVLHGKYNHLEEIDLELKAPNNSITEVDISHNDLKFISPKFLKAFPTLKFLFLSHNKLHHMENQQEFAGFLQYQSILEEIRMAYNGLTFIPYDIFLNNDRLRIIDLSGNNLVTISIKIEHLTHLELLNLKWNRIKILPERFRNSLTFLVNTQKNSTGSNKSKINLDNNDLECSCQTKELIEWMNANTELSTRRQYRCKIGGSSVVVNADILKEANYLCIRKTVIISSLVSSCVVVVFIAIGVGYHIHKVVIARRRDRLQRYYNAFQNRELRHGNTVVEYIAFLAHSSADVDIAVRVIHNQLENGLRQMTGMDRSLVCMGDKDFLPGFSIIEQQMQCLEKSCVAIFVVSEAFCRSEWCQKELNEAYEQQKPALLIFTENIKEDQMSPMLLRIFKRQVRAALHNRDGEYVLEPPWEVLCNAVILKASMHH